MNDVIALLVGQAIWDTAMAVGLVVTLGALISGLMVRGAHRTKQGRHRRVSRDHKLGQAYERARRVRFAGTGEQGRPYSLYTDRINE